MYADSLLEVFSQRYAGARETFLDKAETSSIVDHLEHIEHAEKGPNGEKLFCDIAWAGNRKADNVLVLISGVHGVEGGVGSAIQSDFVSRHRRLPEDICVVVIHALNPWGFAWVTRHDHEGIDVNRNFVEFDKGIPETDSVAIWNMLEQGKLKLEDVAYDRHKLNALTQGQYHRADAPYYGGLAPSWSHNVVAQVVEQINPAKRKKITVIDLHSGLGPYGYGELICDHPVDSKGEANAIALYGATVTEPAIGTSDYGYKYGLQDYYWHQQGEHVCFVTLEMGTFGNQRMLEVILDDYQLHSEGKLDWSDDNTMNVKHAMQDFFCPTEKQWQELTLFRGRQVIEIALAGLSETGLK